VLRVNLRGGTLHPQFLGLVYIWWRTSAQTQEIMITHEVADLIPPEQNPVVRVGNGEILRRRLDAPEAQLDFAILHDLKARGRQIILRFQSAVLSGPAPIWRSTSRTCPRWVLRAGNRGSYGRVGAAIDHR
jgi:hypothetical protein